MDEENIIGGDDVLTASPEPSADDISYKQRERKRLEDEIAAFLAGGGKISEIPPNVVADPPKKPQSNYGGQPI
ncbi:hypothetical protein SAMN02745866_00783 [Alteromonadaceae bacterium Bs31]|nr:hypothetical protein SAMN02745866_00783 [Alteromonadaceae bacterium Bs31]